MLPFQKERYIKRNLSIYMENFGIFLGNSFFFPKAYSYFIHVSQILSYVLKSNLFICISKSIVSYM